MGRLLLVDDNEEFRDTISGLLSDSGHEVLSVSSPEEGRAELARGAFDLVICDLVMPLAVHADEWTPDNDQSAMVGAHAIGQFTREFPEVPVIGISGELVGQPLGILKQFGATLTLSKPVSRQELLRAVDSAMAAPKPSGH
jgi:CheY-like chemotaxis protein